MELKDIYSFADAIIEKVEKGEINQDVLKDIVVDIKVPPHILYGIDKEFYRITHNGNTIDFKHMEEINVKLYNLIQFKISKKL